MTSSCWAAVRAASLLRRAPTEERRSSSCRTGTSEGTAPSPGASRRRRCSPPPGKAPRSTSRWNEFGRRCSAWPQRRTTRRCAGPGCTPTFAVDCAGTDGSTSRAILCRRGTSCSPPGAGPLPPVAGLAAAGPLTNETLFDLREQPASLVVLGGGAIGVEMARAFARLGTRVTLLERDDRLLAREERDAAAVVRRALERDGVVVRTGVGVEIRPAHRGRCPAQLCGRRGSGSGPRARSCRPGADDGGPGTRGGGRGAG